jgi:hypothetical protein
VVEGGPPCRATEPGERHDCANRRAEPRPRGSRFVRSPRSQAPVVPVLSPGGRHWSYEVRYFHGLRLLLYKPRFLGTSTPVYELDMNDAPYRSTQRDSLARILREGERPDRGRGAGTSGQAGILWLAKTWNAAWEDHLEGAARWPQCHGRSHVGRRWAWCRTLAARCWRRSLDKSGLTAALSVRLSGLKQRRSGHDPGRVIAIWR